MPVVQTRTVGTWGQGEMTPSGLSQLEGASDTDSMGFVASGFHLCGPGGRVKGEVWLPGGLV